MPLATRVLSLLALLLCFPAHAARVTVPGTSVSIDVPAGFVPMPKSVIDSKYSRGGLPPTAVYSTPGPHWEVNIAFALRDTALPAGDLAPVQAGLERSISATPGFRWVKRGIVKSAGREWIDLQFWVDGLDTPIYNHLRVTREGQKTLLVTANVTKKLYAKYAAQLDAAMNGLK
ncbi:hypothetical protein [Deinococcus ruber]|uniref:DUF1795 domain-containing protein n=1 Tax=Deinococcus ruber TaxID=1848197 RepID=A0A918BXH7_9DEIO|nr:hypothetical protein [Deinococcus ruber]GGQ97300.1 hypothetical protein GCM10008957_07080 [Deinococcus ruber]